MSRPTGRARQAGAAGEPEAAPTVPVSAHLLGLPGQPEVLARVAPDGWRPEADVALLRLDHPQPVDDTKPLRRRKLEPRLPVWMCGYPRSEDGTLNDGHWVAATVSGRVGRRDELIQLDAPPGGRLVQPGFSGCGVADDAQHYVLGMVVGRHEPVRSAYMLPTETIERYLPQLGKWIAGRPAVDPALADRPYPLPTAPLDTHLARRITGFLEERKPGRTAVAPPLEILVIPDADTTGAITLRRTIRLADRALSAGGRSGDEVGHAPEGTVPRLGSLDLAIDASARTVDEVAQQIADRIGLDSPENEPARGRITHYGHVPLTVLVDGVDRSPDPMALLDLLEKLAERGSRLLLVYREPSSPSLERARAIRIRSTEPVEQRLARIAGQAAEVARLEEETRQRREYVAARITPVPDIPDTAGMLQIALVRLGFGPHAPGLATEPQLAALQQAVDDALSGVHRARQRLEALLVRRAELRGLLEADRTRLAERGLGEDLELARLHRKAQSLLWTGPCDLAQAAGAVERHAREGRRRLDAERRDLSPEQGGGA